MLSTAKIRRGSWAYYAQQVGRGACEYFLGLGEAPGRWHGRGLEPLGLAPGAVVAEAELEALFGRALHPGDGHQLGRAWRADAVTGYDLCLSAPKSVSVLWALGGERAGAAVLAAHRAAVTTALDHLDAHAAYSRVGLDGTAQVGTDGFAAAVFDHRTSRAGDPQLHSHALVVNKVRCADGGWRTIDGHEIYAHKKSAGTLYQAALRNELTARLGVSWTPVSRDGQAEIAGVPRDLMELWSKRTAQVTDEAEPAIAGYEQQLGRPLTSAERTAVSKVAVLKTRPTKETVDMPRLAERWTGEAAAAGWDGPTLEAAVAAARQPRPGREEVVGRVDRMLLEAVRAAGARRAAFTRSDLAAEIAARVPVMGFDADMVRDLVEHWTTQALHLDEAVPLRSEHDGPVRASDARYASATTLAMEREILGAALAGRDTRTAVVEPYWVLTAARAAGLDPDQMMAIGRILVEGDAISVLVAPAGTGKTTTLGVAVQACAAQHQHVIALAPSARAAKELATATGLAADTVAKFLHEQPHAQQQLPTRETLRYRLSEHTVLIVDEASMLATEDLHTLTRLAWAHRAKLLLVGDPAQIGAIDRAGGMLPVLAQALDAPILGTVHRFREDWERDASLALRRGDPASAQDYLTHGRVHPVTRDADPVDAVFWHYTQLAAGGRQVLMLARTHHDVDALNDAARTWAVRTGQVHGEPLLVDAERDWRAGDRIRATRNDRAISLGQDYVRNGDLLQVTGRTRDGLTVRRLDRDDTATLPADYMREHTAYGWATTIDAAQGATVDHALLLARPGLDRSRLYVGLTRGRDSNHLYLATEPEPEIRARGATVPEVEPAEQLRQIIARDDSETAAISRLPDTGTLRPPAWERRPSRDELHAAREAVRAASARHRDDAYQHALHHEHHRDLGRGR